MTKQELDHLREEALRRYRIIVPLLALTYALVWWSR